MKDPFFIRPIPWLSDVAQPLADYLGLPVLPLHVHEIVFSLVLYMLIYYPISPFLSSRIVPQYYSSFNRRTRINWDAHVVSLFQSILISTLAFWITYADEELRSMDREERVWAYNGGAGMIQAFFVGYFIWDLSMALLHFEVFGPGALAHAVCALTVYTVGYVSLPTELPN